MSSGSGSGSGKSLPRVSSPTPSTSRAAEALAGAGASTWSPPLATPSDGVATTSKSAGTSHSSTPQNAVAQVAGARRTSSRYAIPRQGTSQAAKTNLVFKHILIKHKESRKPIDYEDKPVTRTKGQAMALVIDIHEKITRDLITFANAALTFSDCASARHEGDIQSRFKTGKMQKSFKKSALALTPGKISGIVETSSGYHIIQRVDGTVADSDRHGRDRTRSRSPHLATPSDGDATTSDSIATPRHSTRRHFTPRHSTPRDAVAQHEAPRASTSRDATR